MPTESIPPEDELSETEAALGSLVPARGRVNRDLVMYRAGQAAARPPAVWRPGLAAVTACFAMVALGEAVLLARRPETRVIERVVMVREPAPEQAGGPGPVVPLERADTSPPRAPTATELTDYERLAGQVLRYGLDGLPGPSPAAADGRGAEPVASRDLLREELRKTLDPGDHS
jgi:hypothetical protein